MTLLSINHGDEVPYLFVSKSGVVEFVVIEEGLIQLNEYCYMIQQGAINEYNDSIERLETQEKSDQQNKWAEVALQGDMLQWKHTNEIVINGTILMLIFASIEKYLLSLCDRVGVEAPRIRPKGGQSKIDAYLHFLKTQQNLEFTVTSSTQAALDCAKTIRNSFAHGEWEAVESELSTLDPTRLFGAANYLFDSIENSYMSR